MGDSLRYKDWFEKAAHDLRGAEILMEHDGGNDLVAFHCQQAMEKMLKGWLLKTTGELLDGHSLVFLCRKATAAGAPLKGKLRDCAYVNQFYIETRYPSDSYIPVSEEEARDCMDAARKLMELLAYYLTTIAKNLGSLVLQGFRGFSPKWRKFVQHQPNPCAARLSGLTA